MRLLVERYEEATMCHICKADDGETYRVDLLVSGELPEGTRTEDLIGQVVHVHELAPCAYIAYGVHQENLL